MMDDYAEYRDDVLSYQNEDEYSIDNEDDASTSSQDRAELEIALYSQIHFEHDPSLDFTDKEVSQVLLEEEIPEVPPEEHELNWRERLLGGLGTPAKAENGDAVKTPKITPKITSKEKSKVTKEIPVTQANLKPKEKKEKKTAESSKSAVTKPETAKKKSNDKEVKKGKANESLEKKKSKLTHLIYREDPENKLSSLEMKKTISKASTPKNQTSRVIVQLDSDDSNTSAGFPPQKNKQVFLDDLIVIDSISESESDSPGKAKNPISLEYSDLDISEIEPPVDTGGGKKERETESSDSDESSDDDSSDDSIVELQHTFNLSTGDIQTNLTGVRKPIQRRQPLTNNPSAKAVSPEDLDLEDDNVVTIDDVHTSLAECDWSLVTADKFSGKTQTVGRYFRKLDVTCHNCKEKGHLSKICPKPRKLPVCLMCGADGHMARTCPMSVCFNCLRVGHRREDCDEPRRSLYAWCNRCGMQGHTKGDCSDIWRQYHMTTEPGPLNEVEMKQNTHVFCYNCASQGHWGHECEENFMDRFKFPQLPFVSFYSGPNASADSVQMQGQKALTKSERRKDKKHQKAFDRQAQGKPQSKKQKMLTEGAFVRNALNAEKGAARGRAPGAARGRAPVKKRRTQNEQFEAEYQNAIKQSANSKKERRGKKYQTRGGVEAQHSGDFPRNAQSRSRGQGRDNSQGYQNWNGSHDNSGYQQSPQQGNKRKRPWNESNSNRRGGHGSHDDSYSGKRPRFNKEKTQNRDNSSRPGRQKQKQKQRSTFTSERGFRGYHN